MRACQHIAHKHIPFMHGGYTTMKQLISNTANTSVSVARMPASIIIFSISPNDAVWKVRNFPENIPNYSMLLGRHQISPYIYRWNFISCISIVGTIGIHIMPYTWGMWMKCVSEWIISKRKFRHNPPGHDGVMQTAFNRNVSKLYLFTFLNYIFIFVRL